MYFMYTSSFLFDHKLFVDYPIHFPLEEFREISKKILTPSVRDRYSNFTLCFPLPQPFGEANGSRSTMRTDKLFILNNLLP